MRTLAKNQQKMYYSLFIGEMPIYELDENGNKIVDYVDNEGNVYYRETGEYKNAYTAPVEFYGSIAMSGGESEVVEFGVNLADYSAILIVNKQTLPISETSLIWHKTEPIMGIDGYADQYTADYTVVKLSPSLNIDKYVLQKVVK